jgi:hypothetical protein
MIDNTKARRTQINGLRQRLFRQWSPGPWNPDFYRLEKECPLAYEMYGWWSGWHGSYTLDHYDLVERELRDAWNADRDLKGQKPARPKHR